MEIPGSRRGKMQILQAVSVRCLREATKIAFGSAASPPRVSSMGNKLSYSLVTLMRLVSGDRARPIRYSAIRSEVIGCNISIAWPSELQGPYPAMCAKRVSSPLIVSATRFALSTSSGYASFIRSRTANDHLKKERLSVPSNRPCRIARRMIFRSTVTAAHSCPGSTPSEMRNVDARAWSAITRSDAACLCVSQRLLFSLSTQATSVNSAARLISGVNRSVS